LNGTISPADSHIEAGRVTFVPAGIAAAAFLACFAAKIQTSLAALIVLDKARLIALLKASTDIRARAIDLTSN
jgi:hypothetical protein